MRVALAVVLATLGAAPIVGAHALDPALLEVHELPDGTASVTWTSSAVRVMGARPEPVLPSSCRVTQPPQTTEDGANLVTRWTVDCRPAGLVGQRLGVQGLGPARIDALVRVVLDDGRVVRGVVRPREPMLAVPRQPSRATVLRDYLRLGGARILTQPIHLLLVLGLVLLAAAPRRLVATVTAFTVGHSLTLTAAVLGLVRVPPGPATLMIAVSVFVLAVELSRRTSAPTFMRRFPWAVAGLFGLLHGLGFAGALRAVGLPDAETTLALLAFNAGVELGQLLFIAVVLGVRAGLDRVPARRPRWTEWAPVYGMGTLAAFWCFQCVAALIQ